MVTEDLGAGNERGVDVEVRVVSGRSDEPHRASLDVRQEDVLLCFVETMDLVDEENGRLVTQLPPLLGLADLFPDFP